MGKATFPIKSLGILPIKPLGRSLTRGGAPSGSNPITEQNLNAHK